MKLILCALLIFPCLAAATELRILTYNIHHGEGTDGKFDLERIAAIIAAEKPDLVAIQEVDVKTRRADGVDQAAELIRLTGMHGQFGKFMDYDGGEYGQMVLSRFPIKKATNHPLPKGPEPRTALAIEIDVPGAGALTFVGNHLYATAEQRLAQARELARLFSGNAARTILAGDFNSEPDDPVVALLREHWQDPGADASGPTWPSVNPEVEIDYVFIPTEARASRHAVIEGKIASDHCPLACTLRLP